MLWDLNAFNPFLPFNLAKTQRQLSGSSGQSHLRAEGLVVGQRRHWALDYDPAQMGGMAAASDQVKGR